MKTTLPLVILGFASTLYGQDAAVINQLKADLAFSTWPPVGGGPLKRGLNFQTSDYPALAGFSVAADSLVTDYAAFGLIRKLELVRGGEQLAVSIGVALGSTGNGHELFLRAGPGNQELVYADAYERGDALGIPVGDLNFISQDAIPPDVGGYIAFLRNNVVCILRNASPGNPLSVDLRQLAAAMDARIMLQPNLNAAQFNAGRPDIQTFTSNAATLQAMEGVSTTLNVLVVDHTTPTPEPILRSFQADGNFTIVDNGTTVTVSPTSALGLLPIELFASNASLQFRTATLNIFVTP
jgi:hypothetical protein